MRYFTLLFCLTLSLTLSAQYERGNWYLNTASQYGVESPYTRFEGTTINLDGGAFVANRLLVGARFRGGGFFDGGTDLASVYARYYVPLSIPRVHLFAEAELGYRSQGSIGRLAVGAEYEIRPGILLNAALSYQLGGRRDIGSLNVGMALVMGNNYRSADAPGLLRRRGSLLLNGNLANLSITSISANVGLFGDARVNAGYFVSERFLVEGGLAYYGSSFNFGTTQLPRAFKTRTLAGQLGLRYFVAPGKRLDPYVGAGLAFEHRSGLEERSTTTREYNESRAYVNARAGLLYHLNDRAALDLNLRLNKSLTGSQDNLFITGGVGVQLKLAKQ